MSAVTAVGVTKRFGPTTALDDVGIELTPGETHALVGRNGAGKSTLVSILTGLVAPDTGTVRFNGDPAPSAADRDGWRRQVACVYQRSTIIPTLTVAENLFLNRQARGVAPIRWGRLRSAAKSLLENYGVAVDPGALAGELNVEQRQLVEIARALSLGTRFIILDEPTARLDATAIERLFTRMRALSAQGVTLLFISHHLREVYEVCDRVTVLRDAKWILTGVVDDVSHDALVGAMTGEAVGLTDVTPRAVQAEGTVLSVKGLRLQGFYDDIDLEVGKGEVVGITGSGSSGKVSLAETVGGLRRADAGAVEVEGRAVQNGVPAALKAGIGLVPEDRHREGLVPTMSVAENATMPVADRMGPAGTVLPARVATAAADMVRRYDIRTPALNAPVSSLSGGNAQKVVLARALSTGPRVLVLINPTAGVDVRSKESLLGAVRQAADTGTAVLMVSDELDDLRHCDRVLVMVHGRVTAEFPAGWEDARIVAAVEGVSPK